MLSNNRAFGSFTGASSALNVLCGFIPDHVILQARSPASGNVAYAEYFGTAGPGTCAIWIPAGTETYETSGGISPYTVLDNTIPARWTASTAHIVGDVVHPVGLGSTGVPPGTQNLPLFVCTTAGTSGSTEPTWSSNGVSTVSDGTVVWTPQALLASTEQAQTMPTGQGFTVGTSAMTSGLVYDWIAEGGSSV